MNKAEQSQTLIIGSGFAAYSVASQLDPTTVLLLERGEARSFAGMRQKYDQGYNTHKQFWQNARNAYASDYPMNKTYKLSPRCFSQFEFIEGGSSNRWTGRATRLAPEIFAKHGDAQWPISYEEIAPWYQQAEKMLNITADPEQRTDLGVFENADYWKKLFTPHFPIRIDPQAKNGLKATDKQGLCCGAGDCEACPVDAKSRPANLFNPLPTKYLHKATEILFENDKAVGVVCETPQGLVTIPCDTLIVAAHAIESAKLVHNSKLPDTSISPFIGKFYQDHALAQLVVEITTPFKATNLKAYSTILFKPFSKKYEGIQTVAYGSVAPLSESIYLELLNEHQSVEEAYTSCKKLMMVDILLEMPPSLGIYLDFSQKNPKLVDDTYMKIVPTYDKIVAQIIKEMQGFGLTVKKSLPHYRHTYGTHHIMGTLNMRTDNQAVVDSNQRLLGTQNVYVSGSAVFPRSGANNPTLTLTALGLRLGQHLRSLST